MKLRNIIQALWPGFWLTGFTTMLVAEGDTSALFQTAVSLVWFVCALLLHPHRKWSWWACFVPVAACALLGIVFLGGLAHLIFFPDYWADSNQPGAILILSGLIFLVPSTLLMWHLFVLRCQFHETANAEQDARGNRR